MIALAEWAQSIIYLNPNPELLHSVDRHLHAPTCSSA